MIVFPKFLKYFFDQRSRHNKYWFGMSDSPPEATELMQRRELSRGATNGHSRVDRPNRLMSWASSPQSRIAHERRKDDDHTLTPGRNID
jgi:hypothetical protein